MRVFLIRYELFYTPALPAIQTHASYGFMQCPIFLHLGLFTTISMELFTTAPLEQVNDLAQEINSPCIQLQPWHSALH